MAKTDTLMKARAISYQAYLKALQTPLNTRNVCIAARLFDNITARVNRHVARVNSRDCFIIKPTTELTATTNHRQRLAMAVQNER